MSDSNKHGLSCPTCEYPLVVSIDMILKGELHCISCGLELTVDAQKSAESIQKLHLLQQAQNDLSQTINGTLPKGSVDTLIKGNN